MASHLGLTRHSSDGHVARLTLYSDLVVIVPKRILDHISWAIITHFAKNMLDMTFLGLFRQLATTCPTPPTERKDKWDDKVIPPTISDSRLQDNDDSVTL